MAVYRLSLDREVMENFRKAVENMKSTLGLSALQVPEDLLPTPTRNPVQYKGPKEIISGLEVVDGFIYVSYQGMVIKRFNLQVNTLRAFSQRRFLYSICNLPQSFSGCVKYTCMLLKLEKNEVSNK